MQNYNCNCVKNLKCTLSHLLQTSLLFPEWALKLFWIYMFKIYMNYVFHEWYIAYIPTLSFIFIKSESNELGNIFCFVKFEFCT